MFKATLTLALSIVALSTTACGGPADQLSGTYKVNTARYLIRDVFDGDFNLPPTDETQTFESKDVGTMAFLAEPSGYGDLTFSRTLSKNVDRTNSNGSGFVDVAPVEVRVGYGVESDGNGITVFDAADEWNGIFTVDNGIGGVTLKHTVLNDFSPTQRRFEDFVYELGR